MQPFFTGLGDDISNTDSAQNDAADEFGGLVIPPSLDLFVYSRADGKDPYDVVFEQMRDGTVSDRNRVKFMRETKKRFIATHPERAEDLADSSDESIMSDFDLPLPWNDPDLLSNIPDLFTLDLTSSADQNGDILCECQKCREWVRAMYKAYREPKFCVRTIENSEDVHFYEQRDIPWPPRDSATFPGEELGEDEAYMIENYIQDGYYDGYGGKQDDSSRDEKYEHSGEEEENDEYEDRYEEHDSPTGFSAQSWNTEDDDESVDLCEYSQAMVMCLGRDEDLGTWTSNNRLHVRICGIESTFRVRACSFDDPSIEDFRPEVGGVLPRPASEDSWERARAWLAECELKHERCRYRDSQASDRHSWPSRLVDVGCVENGLMRLVPTGGLSPELIADGYLALSYCWGPCKSGVTTVVNNFSERHVTGFMLEDQPPTIRNAVYAAQQLGFRFLWIDSLCIVQDDTIDKNSEIAKMHQIYQHAKLLISASRASAASEGFLKPVNTEGISRYELSYSLPFKYLRDGVQGCVMLEMFHERFSRAMGVLEPIHTRAWTMQEHIISNRILSFGTTGVRWQCLGDMSYGSTKWSRFTNLSEVLSVESHMKCRQGPPADPRGEHAGPSTLAKMPVLKHHPDESSVATEWNQLRGDYICRELTNAEDSLVAFSAISRQFIPLLGREEDYIAGHWRSQLPSDLLWSTAEFRDRLAPFPSWSWASQRGGSICNASGNFFSRELALERTHASDRDGRETARVLETDVELQDPRNRLGDVRSAKLLIRGKTIAVALKLKEESKGSNFDDSDDEAIENFEYKIRLGDIKLSSGLSGKIPVKFEANLDTCYSAGEGQRGRNIILNPDDDYYLLEIIQFYPAYFEPSSEGLIVQYQQQHTGTWGDHGEFIRVGTFKLPWQDEDKDKDEESVSDRGPHSLFEFEQERLLVLV